MVLQVPGIFDGHARAYPRRLWNAASTMYWVCSFLASCTQKLASQPALLTSFSQVVQLVWAGDVRSPQCRNSPAVAARSQSWRGLNRSARAGPPGIANSAATRAAAAARTATFLLVRIWGLSESARGRARYERTI